MLTHFQAEWSTSGTVVYPVSTSTAGWTAGASSVAAAVSKSTSAVWSYTPTTPALGVYTGAASVAKVGGALAGVAGVAAMLL